LNHRSANVQVFAAAADIPEVRLPCAADGEALFGCDAVRSAEAADPVLENPA